MSDPIRIGSRGSQLALWQANHIADALRAAGHAVEIEVIHTTGDRLQQPEADSPAAELNTAASLAPPTGGKGIFIKEIEEALAEGRIDLAVHSLKDLPTALDPRFTLAAIPPRADPRDAYVCPRQKALHTLPTGALVGTASPRRRAISRTGSMSAAWPNRCTGMMALVRPVMSGSMPPGSRLKHSGHESVNTGLAPTRTIDPAVAKNVNDGQITSSPGPIPSAISATRMASVPEDMPTPKRAPATAAAALSNCSTSGP